MYSDLTTPPNQHPSKEIETQTTNIKAVDDNWAQEDTAWVISLFGTAVGAGILFLTINAGLG
ncbi:hypothetical protein LCGC14_2045500, partial [marine sediment metagenome]